MRHHTTLLSAFLNLHGTEIYEIRRISFEIGTVTKDLSAVDSKDQIRQILIAKVKEIQLLKEIIQKEIIFLKRETFIRSELDKNQIWAKVENMHLEDPSEWPLRFYFNLRRV